ncbi:DUF6233 domain-containing protein [Streptomyces sp. NPDC006326]|uniref:DUF6233 domain-containing protein n=1 Tax=Streptomyces sp. NPDC006326 TaxID=3156752 RepID=UPI0033A15C76
MILLCFVGHLAGTVTGERREPFVSSLQSLRAPRDRRLSYSGHPGGNPPWSPCTVRLGVGERRPPRAKCRDATRRARVTGRLPTRCANAARRCGGPHRRADLCPSFRLTFCACGRSSTTRGTGSGRLPVRVHTGGCWDTGKRCAPASAEQIRGLLVGASRPASTAGPTPPSACCSNRRLQGGERVLTWCDGYRTGFYPLSGGLSSPEFPCRDPRPRAGA